MERCFPLNDFRKDKQIAEVTRMAVALGFGNSRLSWLLMRAAYQRCFASGVTHMLLDTYVGPGSPFGLYDRLGFELLGGPYYDPSYLSREPVYALVADLVRIRREWPVARPAMYRFFTAPAEEIPCV